MRTVFFDIDTQYDFLFPAGALYAPGAESAAAAAGELNRWAAARGIPVVSTTDAHAENDPEFASWPHCISGTLGQTKPAATLLDRRTTIPNRPAEFALAPQMVIEKQHIDCFTNVNLPRLLAALEGGRYVVYGVVTEICVRCAAMGLLATGKPVAIVTDAVREISPAAAQATLLAFQEAGGTLTTVAEIQAGRY